MVKDAWGGEEERGHRHKDSLEGVPQNVLSLTSVGLFLCANKERVYNYYNL